jgi:hypothetical protein
MGTGGVMHGDWVVAVASLISALIGVQEEILSFEIAAGAAKLHASFTLGSCAACLNAPVDRAKC